MKAKRFGNTAEIGDRRLVGVHPIAAWLVASPKRVKQICYQKASSARIEPLLVLARQKGVPTSACDRDQLNQMAGDLHHQGVVASCEPFPYRSLQAVLERHPSLIVVTDHIQDPHNLGAVIRSADAAGAGAILLPEDRAASVSPAVEIASAGATAWLPIGKVVNLHRAFDLIKSNGYWIMTLVPRGGENLFDLVPPKKLALVVGGEGGVGHLVRKRSDFAVSIPMWGHAESLNASVAAAVGLFEIRRRWHQS